MADHLLASLMIRFCCKTILAGHDNGKIIIWERILFGVPSMLVNWRLIRAYFFPRILFGL